uniref:Uncharacterized protein n=1 Tax=Timema bartmani TaxID=61472 RepID=A0A7R9FBE6_9NEOP|nr:unnamed protein product [Timema bartmani]
MNPSILYMNCFSHCLALALVSPCSQHKEIPLKFDLSGVVQLIYSYIEGSPRLQALYEYIVKTTNSKLRTLTSLSETRWACRSEAVFVVHDRFNCIFKANEETIEDTSDSKARAKLKGILLQIKSFNFIVSLEIMHTILQQVVKTSKTLQSPDIDLCQAIDEVLSLAIYLVELINDGAQFDVIYSRAKDACDQLGNKVNMCQWTLFCWQSGPQKSISIENSAAVGSYFENIWPYVGMNPGTLGKTVALQQKYPMPGGISHAAPQTGRVTP